MAAPTVAVTRRWPPAGPDQLPLLLASVAVAVGSFLPWVVVGDLELSGWHGGGLWTFYAATLGIAGGLVPSRALAATSALASGLVAAGIGCWQVLHLAARVGFEGWHPGLGLVAVILGGVIALRSAWRLGAELRTG
jgi:hypothetical protein